jgi:hypothetical protein
METLVRDLHLLWRAESIVADIQFRELMRRSEIRAFAALCAIFSLLMLNLAGFFGFQQWWGSVWAAVAMSAVDLIVAAVLLMLSGTTKAGHNLELARDVRQAALELLEAHAQVAQREVSALHEEVCRFRAALAGLAHNPLDTILPAIVVPLTRALLKALRKPEPAQPAATQTSPE